MRAAAWLPMIANLGYTFTFGVHDQAILTRSLIADIALPCFCWPTAADRDLLADAPAGRAQQLT